MSPSKGLKFIDLGGYLSKESLMSPKFCIIYTTLFMSTPHLLLKACETKDFKFN